MLMSSDIKQRWQDIERERERNSVFESSYLQWRQTQLSLDEFIYTSHCNDDKWQIKFWFSFSSTSLQLRFTYTESNHPHSFFIPLVKRKFPFSQELLLCCADSWVDASPIATILTPSLIGSTAEPDLVLLYMILYIYKKNKIPQNLNGSTSNGDIEFKRDTSTRGAPILWIV